MRSRDEILKALDALAPPGPPQLPPAPGPWPRPAQRVDAFTRALAAAAGQLVRVDQEAALGAVLGADPALAAARCVVSTHLALARDDIGLATLSDARALERVDHALVGAQFGVAENGALWLAPRDAAERALLFLAEHLSIVLSATDLVDDMHAAYARLGVRGVLGHAGLGYGVFVSGPSKTADIEQALVIGAHGPRSLRVFLIGSDAAS